MMLQVVLGAEKRKEQLAPLRRTAAVRENRARLAEVQQGERQVRQGVGASRACQSEESPFVRQQSASARETSKLVNSLAPAISRAQYHEWLTSHIALALQRRKK